jgi:hypothetical protein
MRIKMRMRENDNPCGGTLARSCAAEACKPAISVVVFAAGVTVTARVAASA